MGFLSGWLSYPDRSYEQIKTSVLTRMGFRTPEITDHTEANPYVKGVSIYGGIGEMLGYYIDNAAREAFIDALRRYTSAVSLAKLVGYRVKMSTPASVEVTFTVPAMATGDSVTIAANTILLTADGVAFRTAASVTISAPAVKAVVQAVQVALVTGATIGVSNGNPNQVFSLPVGTVDGSVALTINSLGWTAQESLSYSVPTSKHFVATVNNNGGEIVRFGDNVTGLVPNNGLAITGDYKTTLGSLGNVAPGTITTISGGALYNTTLSNTVTVSVTNLDKASGGDDVETLELLRKRIPLFNRTLERAVTPQDHVDVAQMMPGVLMAGLDYQCGKTIDMYIVPSGGGLASNTLLGQLLTWFATRKMVATRVRSYSAGEVHIALEIDIQSLPQYTNVSTAADVTAALTDFLSYRHQILKGRVEISDLYQVIENLPKVDFSNIKKITAVPYPRPLDTTTTALNATIVINAGSNAVAQWKVTALSSTSYQLHKNGVYQGIYAVGALVPLTEMDLTVNTGSYVIDDRWEFYTYPYNQSVHLVELSLPVAVSADINLTVTGGI